MSNLPVPSIAAYIDQIQRSIFDIQRVFLPNGSYSFTGDINLNNHRLTGVTSLSGQGGSIDLSATGQLNLVSSSVRINGNAPVMGPASAVDGNIAVFDTTSGKLIRDSGIAPSILTGYLLLAGGNMTGPIDSAGMLNLGTVSATSVNIGRVGGYVTIRQPIIQVNFAGSVNPTVGSNIVTAISRAATISGTAVDFTVDTLTGLITYTGPIARTMVCTYDGGISYLTSGYNLYMALIVNPGTPPVMPSADAHLWQTNAGMTSSIWNQIIHGQFVMNPGDTIQLCFRNQSGPVNDVTFQVARLTISARFN